MSCLKGRGLLALAALRVGQRRPVDLLLIRSTIVLISGSQSKVRSSRSMSAKDVHHKIETLQQQVASLRSAATNPAQSQGVLLETLEAFRACWQSCT